MQFVTSTFRNLISFKICIPAFYTKLQVRATFWWCLDYTMSLSETTKEGNGAMPLQGSKNKSSARQQEGCLSVFRLVGKAPSFARQGNANRVSSICAKSARSTTPRSARWFCHRKTQSSYLRVTAGSPFTKRTVLTHHCQRL